jgi:hypothetical protein
VSAYQRIGEHGDVGETFRFARSSECKAGTLRLHDNLPLKVTKLAAGKCPQENNIFT